MIAPVEENATSSAPYAIGEQLIFNGVLCEATSAISIGDTLAMGTNLSTANKITNRDSTPTANSTKLVTSGGVYSADNQIRENIANVEGATSAHPYTVGKQLIFNGLLCKATSAISVGDTLAVGTNLALSDNVVEQIYSLNQGLTNSLANISHENLLDNPWFTVNQRGQSSYSYSSGYTVDRWRIGYGDIICGVTNNGITLSSSILGSNFVQFIEEDFYNKFIAGKDLTLSVLLTDGTIKSATGHAPVNTSYYQNAAFMYITNTCTIVVVGKTGENEQVRLRFTEANSDSVSIRAIKLELGSVSTLAMDTAPNYQQELAKCQRYFQRINIGSGQGFAYGVATSTTTARIVIPLTVPIRDVPPTISISNADQILINGSSHTITKMEYHAYRAQNNFITVTVTTTGLTNEQVCVLRAGNTAEVLEISTDL